MAPPVYLSVLAREDLKGIGAYIGQDNPTRAGSFIREIYEKCSVYAARPGMGRDRADLAAALRSFPHGNYVVFYRPFRRGIQIVRVMHALRDVDAETVGKPR